MGKYISTEEKKLSEYRHIKKEVVYLEHQINELEEMAACIKSTSDFSGDRVKTSSGQNAKFEKIIEKVDSLIRVKREKTIQLIGMLKETEDIIDRCKDPAGCQVLRLRYIEAMSIRAIAEELNYSEQHIYRIRQEAMQEITEIQKNKT